MQSILKGYIKNVDQPILDFFPEMRPSADWTQILLDLPMAEAPGRRFENCNGASVLLSAIIQNAK